MGNKTKQDKILVIKLGALGDFIQALGPMAAIRKHHKTENITLMTTKPFAKLAKKCGYFDHIYIDKKPKIFNLSILFRLKKYINGHQFTRVYDLQNNNRTSLYFKLLKKVGRPEWVGVAKGASHQNTNPTRTNGHAFDGHVQTLKSVGIKNIKIDSLSWIKEDLSRFKLKKPYVLLVPGCAPQHPQKRWPQNHYATLANKLSEKGYQPILLGTEAEKDINASIQTSCPAVLNLTGKTSLFQIVALARKAAGAIGNDTGPMHLIAATGCPCLSLFSGYSDKIKHAPKGNNVQVLQKENLEDLKVQNVIRRLKPR